MFSIFLVQFNLMQVNTEIYSQILFSHNLLSINSTTTTTQIVAVVAKTYGTPINDALTILIANAQITTTGCRTINYIIYNELIAIALAFG